jgi:hypothetical protein
MRIKKMNNIEAITKIKGYNHYFIDIKGNVYSTKRNKPIKLKTAIRHDGRHTVQLSKNGKSSGFYISRLVAEAYLPNPDNLPIVAHKNGDLNDNSVENLMWASHSDNQMHRIVHGTSNRGESHGRSKLKASDVKRIYLDNKTKQLTLAEIFGVCHQSISLIKTKRNWVWLTDQIDEDLDNGMSAQEIIDKEYSVYTEDEAWDLFGDDYQALAS